MRVFIDDRSDEYPRQPEVIQIVGNHMLKDLADARRLGDVTKVNSKLEPVIQVADLLTGAITAAHRIDLNPADALHPGKLLAISRVAEMFDWPDMVCDTMPDSRFNVWHFPKQYRAQPATRSVGKRDHHATSRGRMFRSCRRLHVRPGLDLRVPAARAALEDVGVVQEPVEECDDGRVVAEQLAPVVDRNGSCGSSMAAIRIGEAVWGRVLAVSSEPVRSSGSFAARSSRLRLVRHGATPTVPTMASASRGVRMCGPGLRPRRGGWRRGKCCRGCPNRTGRAC